jgi:hypothetical protein
MFRKLVSVSVFRQDLVFETICVLNKNRTMDNVQKHNNYINTRCDNLLPGMAAACRWGVESGKLMYPSTFGHVPTCVYMSHRPNEPFVPKQQKKKYVSVVHSCRKNE